MEMFLDGIDIQILDLLKQNSRLKLVDLASKVQLTPSAIKYRLDRLVDTGIIDKFTIILDRKKVGFEVLALLVVYAVAKNQVGSIVDALKNFSEISKISILLGTPDLLAELSLDNMNALINFLKKISQIEEIQAFKTWFITEKMIF